MKIIILVFIIAAVSSFTYAKEFKVDLTGKADISGFTFKDSSKYRLYKSNGIGSHLLEIMGYINVLEH